MQKRNLEWVKKVDSHKKNSQKNMVEDLSSEKH